MKILQLNEIFEEKESNIRVKESEKKSDEGTFVQFNVDKYQSTVFFKDKEYTKEELQGFANVIINDFKEFLKRNERIKN